MAKKDKYPFRDDDETSDSETIADQVRDIFRKHPEDYVAKLAEIGFEYFDDEEDDEEYEEKNAQPENKRQRELVDYFESRTEFSEHILDVYTEEKAAENPNYPLFRKYFKQANKNLKYLLLYGVDNYPGRIDLLSDLSFYHEYDNVLRILIDKYTKACMEQENMDTFSELAKEFYFSTDPDGYEAYYALRKLFESDSRKRKIIDFLIAEEGAGEFQI